MDGTSTEARINVEMLDETTELLELLDGLYIIEKIEVDEPYSPPQKATESLIKIKRDGKLAAVSVITQEGAQHILFTPHKPCGVGLLCKTLLRRIREAALVREVKEVERAARLAEEVEYYDRFSQHFRFGKKEGWSFDEVCQKIADLYNADKNEVANFWSMIHGQEAIFREDTDWLMPEIWEGLGIEPEVVVPPPTPPTAEEVAIPEGLPEDLHPAYEFLRKNAKAQHPEGGVVGIGAHSLLTHELEETAHRDYQKLQSHGWLVILRPEEVGRLNLDLPKGQRRPYWLRSAPLGKEEKKRRRQRQQVAPVIQEDTGARIQIPAGLTDLQAKAYRILWLGGVPYKGNVVLGGASTILIGQGFSRSQAIGVVRQLQRKGWIEEFEDQQVIDELGLTPTHSRAKFWLLKAPGATGERKEPGFEGGAGALAPSKDIEEFVSRLARIESQLAEFGELTSQLARIESQLGELAQLLPALSDGRIQKALELYGAVERIVLSRQADD